MRGRNWGGVGLPGKQAAEGAAKKGKGAKPGRQAAASAF